MCDETDDKIEFAVKNAFLSAWDDSIGEMTLEALSVLSKFGAECLIGELLVRLRVGALNGAGARLNKGVLGD